MGERISDDDLRRLLKDTTPGPWSAFIDDSGGRWTGWPLSVNADAITDKVVVRTGGQWPYEWDAKTSQHEACENARLIALAPALAAEVLQLRHVLRRLVDNLDEGDFISTTRIDEARAALTGGHSDG